MLVQQELTGSVGHEIVCKAYIMPKPFANAFLEQKQARNILCSEFEGRIKPNSPYVAMHKSVSNEAEVTRFLHVARQSTSC